jgi:hypothetical protein
MSTRLSQTMESLHEMQSVDLGGAGIDSDGVMTLANALKENSTVTEIIFFTMKSARRVQRRLLMR